MLSAETIISIEKANKESKEKNLLIFGSVSIYSYEYYCTRDDMNKIGKNIDMVKVSIVKVHSIDIFFYSIQLPKETSTSEFPIIISYTPNITNIPLSIIQKTPSLGPYCGKLDT